MLLPPMANSALTEYLAGIRGAESDQILCYASGMQTDPGACGHKPLSEIGQRALSRAQEGKRSAAVARGLGAHIRTIFCWLSFYQAVWADNLDADKRSGSPPKRRHNHLRWIHEKNL